MTKHRLPPYRKDDLSKLCDITIMALCAVGLILLTIWVIYD
jgi:hypothetical protein